MLLNHNPAEAFRNLHNVAMGKRSRIVLVFLLVAVLGGSAWVVLQPREKGPAWQGEPLGKWLDELDPKTGRLAAPAAEAVRQIGTNGLPWLLQEAATETPFFKQLTGDLLQKRCPRSFRRAGRVRV
jgi:hypothetical protein